METTDYATTQARSEDPLKKRYLYKLSTNLIGFVINLATAGVIPRGLGPVAYGSFDFLSAFFSQTIGFFEAGTSLAFFSKLSQRPQEAGLLRFYWAFAGLVSLATLLFVSIVFAAGLESWLWPDQVARYIWLAAVWGLLTWYTYIINHILDAYGLTVGSELVRIQQRVLGLALILVMFWLNRFSLAEFFLYHYVILLFLCLSWWRVLRRAGLSLLPGTKLTPAEVKGYTREFYDYTAPLIVYSFVGLLVGVLDRWLLQKFAGSVEQGFYGLSYKVGAICFLFTGAMTPLLTREFAKAYGGQDLAHMRLLFQRYIPMLYTIAAFFAAFVAVQADKVSVILGGSEFQGATAAIAIMAFFPIHQTYGQLSSSVFFATGQTKLYRNLGISIMLLGLPLTFWLIAPERWWGLNLGATGLAIKMVALQFIGVQLQLWFNARFLHLSFWRFLGHQCYTVALLAGVAWLVATGVGLLIKGTLLAFLASGFVYTLGVAVMLFLLPSLVFMSRAELMGQLAQLARRYKS